MSRKIGIISYWNSLSNYGQILQAVAMQQILKQYGYEAFHIRYDVSKAEIINRSLYEKVLLFFNRDVSLFSRIKNRIINIGSPPSKKINREFSDRHFDEFKNKYLNFSSEIYQDIEGLNTEEIHKCKYLVVGSDQVWHAASGPKRRKFFLAEFASDSQIRVSYAASFGRDRIILQSEKNEYIQALKKFRLISVREQSACELCNSLGIDAKLVLDPTLLLTSKDWLDLFNIKTRKKKTKHVFVYTLTANSPVIHQVLKYLISDGYSYTYVCSNEKGYDYYENSNATIEDWIAEISSASLVLTDSYHGTIFSVNFNTPFISIGKRDQKKNRGSNQRMYSYLKNKYVLDRFFCKYNESKIKDVLTKTIDWEKINKQQKAERIESLKFLLDSLM